jgi:hypothetical protein
MVRLIIGREIGGVSMAVASRLEMTNLKKHSGGMTAIGAILGLAALVAVVTLSLRLGPHYIDWRTMQSVFEGLKRQPVHEMSKSEIREALAKGFRINSLRDFDQRNMIQIDVEKEYTTLTVSYEQREHIIMNVDVVLSFSETFRYP